jgi:hypothetical protein
MVAMGEEVAADREAAREAGEAGEETVAAAAEDTVDTRKNTTRAVHIKLYSVMC